MTEYFEDCITIEEAKKLFKKLIKQNHPDIIGNKGVNISREIIKQYDEFKKSYWEDEEFEDLDADFLDESEDNSYDEFTDNEFIRDNLNWD